MELCFVFKFIRGGSLINACNTNIVNLGIFFTILSIINLLFCLIILYINFSILFVALLFAIEGKYIFIANLLSKETYKFANFQPMIILHPNSIWMCDNVIQEIYIYILQCLL